MQKKIAVLGCGSWGTVLSHLLASSGNYVNLWARSESFVEHINKTGRFIKPVEMNLPESVNLTSSLEEALLEVDMVVCAVPSEAVNELIEKVKEINTSIPLLLSATKGLAKDSAKRMSELWIEAFGCDVAVLSGPNLSAEAALAKPMKTIIASQNLNTAKLAASYFKVSNLKVETSNDVVGTEIAGATKNVIALIAGAWDGLNLGTSGKGAMLTRAVVELANLVSLMGGERETAYSVAGLGDLYITCSSNLSRNYRTGYLLAQGKSFEFINSSLNGQVSEGYWTAPLINELVKKYGADFQVCEAAAKLASSEKFSNFQLEEMLINLV